VTRSTSRICSRRAVDTQQPDEAQVEVDDAPVVRFLQKLLLDAIGEGASDLHLNV